MISAILLRNFKNYNNIHFIPICNDVGCRYSIYVGNNGVGKSAILEALDVFFNDRFWNTTLNSKRIEAYICPVFLLEKSKVNNSLKEDFECVSDIFWNLNVSKNPNYSKTAGIKELIEYKDNDINRYKETHYLIILGKACDGTRNAYSPSFDKPLKDAIKSVHEGKDNVFVQERINSMMKYIESVYTYIYYPVEEQPDELLKLQSVTMQKLLNKNVLDEIDKLLNRKANGSTIVENINSNLDGFIAEVNSVIESIDGDYSFTTEANGKKKLTSKDIREKVLEAYFPLRTLKVSGKRVNMLSSGEQRRALIEVACSVIIANGDRKTEKELIIAIDEPEASMHVSNCFRQFTMLEELALKYGKQVVITTHWYGFLPIARAGCMHYIYDDKNNTYINSFDLFSVLENRKNYPDVIELKSMYDLATSIVTFMRTNSRNWIICEGIDDKVYLECVLHGENVNIVAVGGCGNVKKLFYLLYTPLSEKNENRATDSKVMFLIDTDLKQVYVKDPLEMSSVKEERALIRRLQIDNGIVELYNPIQSNNTYEQTEIEDCLNPEMYYLAIMNCIGRNGTSNQKKIIKKYSVNEESKNSKVRGDNSCLIPKDMDAYNNKQIILEYIENSSNKFRIAEEYQRLCEEKKYNVEHRLKECILKELCKDDI